MRKMAPWVSVLALSMFLSPIGFAQDLDAEFENLEEFESELLEEDVFELEDTEESASKTLTEEKPQSNEESVEELSESDLDNLFEEQPPVTEDAFSEFENVPTEPGVPPAATDDAFSEFEDVTKEPGVPPDAEDVVETPDEFELEPLPPGEELDLPMVEEPVFPDEPLTPEPSPIVEPEPFEPVAEAPTPGFDEPDLSYERRLHDIYQDYHSKPTAAQDWQNLISGRQSEVYNIQSGDTLWGISETFFGDGNYWPKIWSLNDKIANPHLIQPGNQIRFVLGDEQGAPAFSITSAEEVIEEESVEEAAGGVPTEPDIPPPLTESRPVLQQLPASFPVWQTASRGKYDETGLEPAQRPLVKVQNAVALKAYASAQAPQKIGIVQETEAANQVATVYQYVYVSVDRGRAKVGDRFLVVNNRGPIAPITEDMKQNPVYGIQVQGEIELAEQVKGRNDDADLFRALVVKAINPVTTNSELLEGRIEQANLSMSGPRKDNVVAEVIGGEFDQRRFVFGQEAVVFLNRGSNDGLAIGDILPVRSNRKIRNEDTVVDENILTIGYVKIAKLEPKLATALVIDAEDPIRPGDITGSAASLAGGQSIIDDVTPESDFGTESVEPLSPEPDADAVENGFDESLDLEFDEGLEQELEDFEEEFQ